MLITPSDVVALFDATGAAQRPWIADLAAITVPVVDRLIKNYVGYEIEQATGIAEYHPGRVLPTRGQYDAGAAGFTLETSGLIAPITAGSGSSRTLVLTQLPVRSITSVLEGSYPPTSLLVSSAYVLDEDPHPALGALCWSGLLTRIYGVWQRSTRSTLVTYTAGLTASEIAAYYPEFRAAALQASFKAIGDWVARTRFATFGGSPGSVSIEDFSVSFANPGQTGLGGLLAGGVGANDLPTEVKVMLQRYVHPASLL